MNVEAKLRSWWWHRQGLDGSLRGASPAEVLQRSGWARSVGGAGPYLTLFARAGTRRAEADGAAARMEIQELPAARGCTYVVPAEDYALALRVAQGAGDGEMRAARKLGVTDEEVERLCAAVLQALGEGAALAPDALREATGSAWRSLGEEGKKKGVTTTLPLALGRLQLRGQIRRVPVDGRLDQQRYAYARWEPGPLTDDDGDPAQAATELARRFFRWVGPATLGELQWFSALSARAVRQAVEPLALVPAAGAAERLLLPEDAAEWEGFAPPDSPQYALVSSLDAISATRRDVASLVAPEDRERLVAASGRVMGSLGDLPGHAILERGRLVGLWEFDAEAGEIVWMTFGEAPDALVREVQRTEAYVRDDLGDARSFSLDSPRSRGPRLDALRRARR